MTSIPIEGFDYFYRTGSVSCGHSPFYTLWDDENNKFCGSCWLGQWFRAEIPSRLHEARNLAENGNPETSPRFWAHIESQLGLIPPRADEDLKSYSLAREQLYGRPSRAQLPVTFAMWKMMGKQPKLAKPLLKSLFSATEDEIGIEFELSKYGVQSTLGKGIRLAMRFIRQ